MDQVNTHDITEFTALIDLYFAAWNTDAIAPAQLYAKDGDAVYYDIFPPTAVYRGWTEFGASAKDFFDAGGLMQITPRSDLQVKQYGEIAWTTVTFHLLVKKDEQSTELDCRQTLVWQKRNDKWLIVHEHDSAPLPR